MYFRHNIVELINDKIAPDTEHGLGRIVIPDARDFPLAVKLMQLGVPVGVISEVDKRYWNQSNWWGDQGRSNACTGFSLVHLLEDGPTTHGGNNPILDPYAAYQWANANDTWGKQGILHEGSTVRAAIQYAQKEGYIKEYHFTQDIKEVAATILNVGPVVFGTLWKTEMFYPDKQGVLTFPRDMNNVAGGHAYEVNGYNSKTRMYRGKQSWGRKWGATGNFYIHETNLAWLLENAGECALAIENKKPIL